MRYALLLLMLTAARTAAAQAPPVPLTLPEAIERATVESQRLAELTARREASDAAILSRRAAAMPIVTVSGGYTRTNHVDEFGVRQPDGALRVIYPDIPDNYVTRTAMQWPIYTGGRTGALVRAAEAEARAAGDDLDTARADLRLEVVRAYWALVTATESVQVVEGALRRADAHLADVRARFDQGLIPPNDVSSVEAQRATQHVQVIEVQNLRASVMEDLRRLTGLDAEILPVEPLVSPADTGATGAAPHPSSAAPSPAPRLRPEQRAVQARIAAAEARIDAARAGRRPTIAFTGAADYANPNPRILPRADRWHTSWELGVTASWTLFDGGRVSAERAEADATARALRARRADLDRMIQTEIAQRRLDVHAASAALTSADAAVRAAEDARRVLAERFAVGVATSTEVLDAEIALLEAELDRTRTRANVRLAEARLDRALGR